MKCGEDRERKAPQAKFVKVPWQHLKQIAIRFSIQCGSARNTERFSSGVYSKTRIGKAALELRPRDSLQDSDLISARDGSCEILEQNDPGGFISSCASTANLTPDKYFFVTHNGQGWCTPAWSRGRGHRRDSFWSDGALHPPREEITRVGNSNAASRLVPRRDLGTNILVTVTCTAV